MSCSIDEQSGCYGRSAFKAWEFTMKKGIVTGGNFGSKEVGKKISLVVQRAYVLSKTYVIN